MQQYKQNSRVHNTIGYMHTWILQGECVTTYIVPVVYVILLCVLSFSLMAVLLVCYFFVFFCRRRCLIAYDNKQYRFQSEGSFQNLTKQFCYRSVLFPSTLCLKKTSPMFLAITREIIVGFS